MVIDDKPWPIEHKCLIPEVIAGEEKLEALVEREAPVKLVQGRAVGVEGDEVIVELRNGGKERVEFDSLVLATGSKPHVPGKLREYLGLPGVFTLNSVADCMELLKWLEKPGVKRAVVAGGGVLGLEVAVALKRRGLFVSLFEATRQLLPGRVDAAIAKKLEEELSGKGISIATSAPIRGVRRLGDELLVDMGLGEVCCDVLVLCTGTAPNAELAAELGLKLGEHGGVLVNEKMESSAPNVYAAGDVAEAKQVPSGKHVPAMQASPAFMQGRVAGINAAGGEEEYPGYIPSWIAHLKWVSIGAAGITSDEAGSDAIAATVSARSRLHGGSRIMLRLIARKSDGVILGVQAVGSDHEAVKRQVDIAVLAIRRNATVWDLARESMPYMPLLSDVVEPIQLAADMIARRI